MEGGRREIGGPDHPLLLSVLLKAEENRVPLEVQLELTHRCNAQCVHCYCVVPRSSEGPAKQRELTTDEYAQLLDELAELGTLYLVFSGGEVLVRRDFFDIAASAKQRGFAFRVFTNGIGLTEQRIERLAALEPLTVELSIYSADPDVHDGITGVAGSFDRLLANVSRLKALGLRMYLKSTVMKPNLPGLERLHRLGKDLGVFLHMYGCEVSPRIAGDVHGPDRYQLDEGELFDYFSNPVWRKRLIPIPEASPEEAAMKRLACAPGLNGCCVDPYGNVLPCVALRLPMGNIRERPLRDLWSSMPPSIQQFLAVRTYADLPECRSCELVNFCHRCHGDNLLARGADWRLCHVRARMVASAEHRLYRTRIRETKGVSHE
jgi:radical SAM protein with 4Fe4S-binding SPASM domain